MTVEIKEKTKEKTVEITEKLIESYDSLVRGVKIAEALMDKCENIEQYYLKLRNLKRRCRDLYERLVEEGKITNGYSKVQFDVNVGERELKNFLDKWSGDPKVLDKHNQLVIQRSLQNLENAITNLKKKIPDKVLPTKDITGEDLAKEMGI